MQRIEPGPGQESVWDYPRPPRVEAVTERVRIGSAAEIVVDTTDAVRVLETSHPPVYYVRARRRATPTSPPPRARASASSRARARYLSIAAGGRSEAGAVWFYPSPAPGYEALAGRVAVYPARMDSCEVAARAVQPQDGDFYGGWITSRVVGPFKGAPGTLGW